MSKRKKLSKIETGPSKKLDKKALKKETLDMIEEIKELQNKMYAQGKYSLLIVFQGMDASGKDGAVKHVFGSINPMGCQVKGFKVPTKEEAAHDFLWRVHQATPEHGMIQIFNRSHYEDVIIPTLNKSMSEKDIYDRYSHIKNFEKLLTDNNTIVLKFLLHIGKDAQEKKLRERLTNPTKHRKHNDGDRSKKEKYDEMLQIYDDMIDRTDTKYAPWTVIPTDKNRYKAHLIATHVLHAFKKRMKLERPELETDMSDKDIEEKVEK
jgi:PPK2 family polyphosphate:nucleotide phosphotransferase